ncbi:MAG: hypothetical protein ACK4SR_05805 [Thiobacillus sp.]
MAVSGHVTDGIKGATQRKARAEGEGQGQGVADRHLLWLTEQMADPLED